MPGVHFYPGVSRAALNEFALHGYWDVPPGCHAGPAEALDRGRLPGPARLSGADLLGQRPRTGGCCWTASPIPRRMPARMSTRALHRVRRAAVLAGLVPGRRGPGALTVVIPPASGRTTSRSARRAPSATVEDRRGLEQVLGRVDVEQQSGSPTSTSRGRSAATASRTGTPSRAATASGCAAEAS